MHIHFLGIKGSGMVSLARILQMQGNNITGSDVSQAYFTDTILDKMGIEPLLFDIQNAENIAADIVVYSAAYDAENNQEFAAWKQKGTKMLGYSEMIAQVTENQNLVAVTGTHGKTTTSAMLAVVMKGIQDQRKQLGAIECHQPAQNENSFEFSAIIGSGVPQFDGMGGYTSFCHPEQTHCHPEQTHCHPEQTHCHPELVSGSNNDSRFWNEFRMIEEKGYFILEACEYRRHFLQYKPQDIIITNIDYDHPDYFKTEDDYVSAFQEFVDSLDAEGSVVIEHKEKDTLNISSKVITYSIDDKEADYYALRTSIISGNQQFLVYEKGKPIGNFQIAVPGMHNISNALAVIAYLRWQGFGACEIHRALQGFSGTTRRQEYIGKYKENTLVYDDYGHHPDEIQKTLKAFREFFPKHFIICDFQSHTYTRTRELWDGFVQSFADADLTIINDIFASAREEKDDASLSYTFARAIADNDNDVCYIPDFDHSAEYIQKFIDSDPEKQYLVLTLWAGDSYQVGKHLLGPS